MNWLSLPSAHTALLDELTKIGADTEKRMSNKQRAVRVLKAVGLAGLGAGAGYGLAVGAQKAHKKFFLAGKPVTRGMLTAAKIGLPILGFAGGIVGSRYRSAMDKAMFGKKPPQNAR